MNDPAIRTGYIPVEGGDLYYEVHGFGKPLVLLHGGLMRAAIFAPILPTLAAGRQIIAADLQSHGHTAHSERPMTYQAMADDIGELIKALGLGRVDVMGYSLGGGVGLRLAIQHPELVDRLVLVSTPFKRRGWLPDVVAGMAGLGAHAADGMRNTPIYRIYAEVAPNPADFPKLLDQVSGLLAREYDWWGEVAKLQSPVLLVYGDADSIGPAHAAEFFALLGGGKKDGSWDGSGITRHRLAILPGETHYTIFLSDALVAVARSFLDDKRPRHAWTR